MSCWANGQVASQTQGEVINFCFLSSRGEMDLYAGIAQRLQSSLAPMPSHAGHAQEGLPLWRCILHPFPRFTKLCVCACKRRCLQRPEVSGSLELELQAVVSLLLGAGIQLKLSGREVGVLKC